MCLLLEPRRDVERITEAGAVLVADDDLAGVDRDPQTEAAHHVTLLTGELAEGALHADGGTHGADGIVLGHVGHAEGAHDAVTEELDDAAPVGFDRLAHHLVVAVHQATDRLRIEAFVQRRRSDQVGEDDRDDLARHRLFAGAGDQRGPAGVAELRAGLALGPTREATRGEGLAAAAAEPRARSVRSPAARAAHGDARRSIQKALCQGYNQVVKLNPDFMRSGITACRRATRQ